MYSTFYGLQEKPFALLTDSRFFYKSKIHQEILDALKLCIQEKKRICMLTGEIGTGKTSLIRYLLEELSTDHNVGFIANTNFPAEELPGKILSVYHQSPGANVALSTQTLYDYLTIQNGKDIHSVLVIDDSQTFTTEAVTVLSELVNEVFARNLGISIILSGEPSLREILNKTEPDSLSKLTDGDFELKNLSQDETSKYISYRIKVAGGTPDLFDDTAKKALFDSTGGIPRSINLLCDSTLVYGYVEESKTITEELVNNVVNDRKGGRLFPALSKAAEIAKKRSIEEKETEKLKSEEDAKIKVEEELARLKTEEYTSKLQLEEEARHKAEQELAKLQEQESQRLKKEEEEEKKIQAKIESLRLQEEEIKKKDELIENIPTPEPISESDEGIDEELFSDSPGEVENKENTVIHQEVINKTEKSRNLKPFIGAAAVLVIALGVVLLADDDKDSDVGGSGTTVVVKDDQKHPNEIKLSTEESSPISTTKSKKLEEERKLAELEKAKKQADEEARRQAALKAEQERKAAEVAKRAAEEKARVAALKAKQEEEKRKLAELEKAKKQADEEARRQAALKAEQERKAAEVAKRAAEEKARVAALKAKQEEEKRKLAELEKAKKQADEEARRQAALKAEQERKAAEVAKRAAEEKARVADLKAKQEEEKRKLAELEKAKKQADEEARRQAALKAEQERKAAEVAKRAAEEKARVAALKAEQERKAAEVAKRAAAEEKARVAALKAKQELAKKKAEEESLQLKTNNDTPKEAEVIKNSDEEARFKVVKVREQGSNLQDSSDNTGEGESAKNEETDGQNDFTANPCDGPAAKFMSTCKKRK